MNSKISQTCALNKKESKDKMNENIIQLITEYVYKHYRTYKDKPLIISESRLCYHVLKHKDASPLILGKGIIK